MYNTIGVICAILNSYFWNRYWAFKDIARGGRTERFKFFAQALINIALNDVIVVVATKYLTANRSIPFVVSSDLAKGLAMLLSSSLTYILLKYVVFRGARTSGARKD